MAQASIYPQFENKPFATLGGLLKQKEELETERVKNDIGRQSIVESQTRVEKAGREAQDAQRKQAQQALAQDAFKRFSRPDGSVDQKAIIAYIQPQDYELAQTIATGFAEYQKKAMDARKVELDNENTQGAMIGNALQGVTPATYPAIWSRINSKDPEMGEFLGQQYDPEKINTALAMVTERGAWNTRTKDILSKDQTHINTALELLANSTDAEQAEDAMAFAKVHGVDDDLQQRGFVQWSPDMPQRAKALLLGQEKTAELEGQAANRSVTMRGQDIGAQTAAANRAVTVRGQDLVNQRAQEAGGGGTPQPGMVDAILKTPSLFHDLPIAEKAKLIPTLSARGFDFTKATTPLAPKEKNDASRIIAEIETLSNKINTVGGGPRANVSGLIRRGMAAGQLDNEVSEYQALITGMIPMVARAVGHSGVLTQQDVDSVRALFPSVQDNAALAKSKLERVKRMTGTTSGETVTPSSGGGNKVGRFTVEVE